MYTSHIGIRLTVSAFDEDKLADHTSRMQHKQEEEKKRNGWMDGWINALDYSLIHSLAFAL